MVFVITGLQARTLIARIGDYSMSELVFSAVVVSAVVIMARFVWIYPATVKVSGDIRKSHLRIARRQARLASH
jgi:NhaP-type Na+/H+ or K+/H+ antiporter